MPENPVEPVQPKLELFIRLIVDVGQPTTIGTGAAGERKLIPIIGGSFSGKLNGEILNGGSDALIIRPDGCAQLNARYCLQLNNKSDHNLAINNKAEIGKHIYVEDRGYRHGPEFVMARLAQGKPVDPKQYYFRTCMTMETTEKEFSLQITIRKDRFLFQDASTGLPLKNMPWDGETVDWHEFDEFVKKVKQRFPENEDITLLLGKEVNYKTMIEVMDHVRTFSEVAAATLETYELFPNISIGDALEVEAAQATTEENSR